MRTFSTLLVMAAVLILQRPPQPTPAPPIGWVTRATVAPEDIYDGDTFTATVEIRVRVRMIDCWARYRMGSCAPSIAGRASSRPPR